MAKETTQATSPYIYRYGTAPNTALLNTLKVKVFSFDDTVQDSNPTMKQIGVLQEWTPADSRANTAVRSIGYGDQIAEINPGFTDITGTAGVMALYTRNIMQVFGYNAGTAGLVRSLKHHRWPFDVREEIVIPLFLSDRLGESPGASQDQTGGDNIVLPETGSKAIMTYYEGCWMNDYGRSYAIGDVSVAESAGMIITDVYDPLNVNFYGEGFDGGNGTFTQGKSRLFSAGAA